MLGLNLITKLFKHEPAAEAGGTEPVTIAATAEQYAVGDMVVDAGGFIWWVDAINYSPYPFGLNNEPTCWLYLVNVTGSATFNADNSIQQPATDCALVSDVSTWFAQGDAFRALQYSAAERKAS